MENIVTYAESRFQTFAERPFGRVDSLILSWLSYLHLPAEFVAARTWEGMPLRDLFCAEHFDELFAGVWDQSSTRGLLTALAASPRFRHVSVKGYTEQLDPVLGKQFSAMTFQIAPDLLYCAFRGTDATVVGWEEDFNLAFKTPVPAQEEAARYVGEAAANCAGKIMTGGHSKGGNLAVYAAVAAGEEVRARMVGAFSHDGPGFTRAILESAAYERTRPIVQKTIPQSSLVGMLLEDHEDYQVVRSRQVGVLQHDPFSWEVDGDDFVLLDDVKRDAKYVDKTLNAWIAGMSDAERAQLTDALFSILSDNDIASFSEIRDEWRENIPAVMRSAANMDPETRKFLIRLATELGKLAVTNVGTLLGAPAKDGGEKPMEGLAAGGDGALAGGVALPGGAALAGGVALPGGAVGGTALAGE